jgi:hypothetical protein
VFWKASLKCDDYYAPSPMHLHLSQGAYRVVICIDHPSVHNIVSMASSEKCRSCRIDRSI